MGAAIADYFKHGKAARLRVFSSQFEEDEIPVSQLFRNLDMMPAIEQQALQLAKGRILDCGAGSGCHSLPFSECNERMPFVAISLTPLNCP